MNKRKSRNDTVLIGTTLGEESDQVVRSGLAVARAAGARAFLLHVAQAEPQLVGYEVGAGPLLDLEQIAQGEEELRQTEPAWHREEAAAGTRA